MDPERGAPGVETAPLLEERASALAPAADTRPEPAEDPEDGIELQVLVVRGGQAAPEQALQTCAPAARGPQAPAEASPSLESLEEVSGTRGGLGDRAARVCGAPPGCGALFGADVLALVNSAAFPGGSATKRCSLGALNDGNLSAPVLGGCELLAIHGGMGRPPRGPPAGCLTVLLMFMGATCPHPPLHENPGDGLSRWDSSARPHRFLLE